MGIVKKIVVALSALAAVGLMAANSFGPRESEALCGGVRLGLNKVQMGSPP
jgi:hypothetical protein